MVGTKLQVIITKMGLRIQERGGVVKGTPLVEPGDELFWFGRSSFLLLLIHIVLFTVIIFASNIAFYVRFEKQHGINILISFVQNAFQLAFFVWSTVSKNLNPVFVSWENVLISLPNTFFLSYSVWIQHKFLLPWESWRYRHQNLYGVSFSFSAKIIINKYINDLKKKMKAKYW